MKYSKAQLEAVTHVNGPMLVLAGPGSGKTAVITGRVKYLIEEEGVDPSHILVITFTKAAAIEMKERARKLMGEDTGVRFSTFHSVFFLIIKHSYGYEAFNIISEEISGKFFREKMKECKLEDMDEKDFVKNALGEISRVKAEGLALEGYYSANFPVDIFRKLFMEYSAFMREKRLIDFDDMMLLCEKLFRERPEVLRLWQEKYRYILIDEFQDSSKLQFALIQQLAKPETNLFVVGDDDQSIYRFRGAKPEIMLGFETLFEDCKKVILDDNYRSSKAIVEFAGKVIKENRHRFVKEIKAKHMDEETLPVIKKFPDRKEEDTYIAGDILKRHGEGLPYSEMAIVYRTNILARSMLSKLMEYNIPFVMKEVVPDIYDHFIARNIFDYLLLAEGSRELGVFLRIMNRPNRFLSRDSADAATLHLLGKPESVSFMRWRDYFRGKAWMVERLQTFQHDLTVMKTLSPFGALTYLRKSVGYETYLLDYAKERGLDAEELCDVLEELMEDSRSFSTFSEWKEHIKTVKEKRKEMERQKRTTEKKDAVLVSTMHGCKGLEFQRVYIPSVVEGVIPYRKAIKQADIEEERRLFYVAITRAKRELFLSVPGKLYGKEKEISPFLKKLMREK